MTSVTAAAPMPPAARSQPRPTAPTPSRSSAIAGSNAIAPPKSTANRSSEIAPSRIGERRMNRRPSNASRRRPDAGGAASVGSAASAICSNGSATATGAVVRTNSIDTLARTKKPAIAQYGADGSTT